MKVKFPGKRKRIVHVARFVKAVSTVVAVLLMIAIAVIASLVAYFWVTGYFKTTSTKISKAIQIENAYYTGQYLGVYVENIGQGKATLIPNQCLYVDGALRTSANVNPGTLQEASYTLQESDIALVVDAISLNLGQTIKIKIVTSEGTFVEYSFTINTFQGQNPFSLALFANPPVGGSVAADNNGPYHYGDVVQLTANPTAGWSFSAWSGDASGFSSTTSVVINGTNTVTATFTQTEYALTLDIVGGGSVSKFPDKATYHYGDSVQLQANAAPGWTFSGWSGDLTGVANPSSVVIDETPEVTATFTQNTYALTVNVDPLGSGTVSLNNTGPYSYGDVVELTANPTAGWSFSAWSQDLTGSANPTTILIDGDKTVTATFTQNQYTLTVNVDPLGSGTVSLNNTGPYSYGDVVELTANPTAGWSFSAWSQDLTGSANPTTILIDGDKTVTATFTQNQYTLTISTVGQGSVSLNNTGPYHYGDVVQLTANPTAGWSFSAWSGDLGGSNNPENILIDGDKSVNAAFSQQTRVIHASAGPHGSISPSGDLTVTYGSDQDFTFTPDPGYSVEDVLVDFVSQGPSDYYNFTNVVAERWISVSFVPSTYTITASYGPGGTIDPYGPVSVVYGNDQAFTITPNVGFHIGNVLVDGGSIGVPSLYTFYSVTADHTIQAFFALDVYTLTFNVNPQGAGIVSMNNTGPYHYGDWVQLTANGNTGWSFSAWSGDLISNANPENIFIDGNKTVTATFTPITFTITASTGSGGQISPSGLVSVNYGDSQAFIITANTGYNIADVLVDGVSVGKPTLYTFTNVVADHTISASFAIQTFIITASAGPNGSINPSGQVSVNYGGSQAFTITPNTGYNIASVLVDGVSQGAIGTYTFTNVQANHTISASFVIKTFTIIASAGSGGSISPSGTVIVNFGNDQSFQITTNTGYYITRVTVDGAQVGNVTYYIFTNVQSSHTIAVTFGQSLTGVGTFVAFGVSDSTVAIQQNETVNGILFPSGSGYIVTLIYTKPDGTIVVRTVTTAIFGIFSDSYNVGNNVGTWSVYASYAGNQYFGGCTSNTVTFIVGYPVSITVTSSPTGSGFVQVNGTSYGTPHTFNWISGEVYSLNALSPVSGSGFRYVWLNWSDGGAQSHIYTVPTSSITVTAYYKTQYQLTMATNLGTTTPAVGNTWYDAGSQVTISATAPSAGAGEQYAWNGWTGAGTGSYSGTDNSHQITVNGAITETASWTHQYQVTFAVTPAGSGTTNPSGTNIWENAGSLSISATASSGYMFSSWTAAGSITITNPSSASTTATINGAGTITANFVQGGIFGNTQQGSSSDSIEDYIRGSVFTSPGYSVTAQSITAYIQVSGTHTIKAAIYTSTGTFVASTQEVSVTTSTDGWVTFAFASGSQPHLTASTSYVLVVWANSASGSAELYRGSSGSGTSRSLSRTYGTWPTSPSFSNGSYNYSIYCTYTVP